MVAGLGDFNETQGRVMSSDMSLLDILQSFGRSLKWAHVKAINLLVLGKVPVHPAVETLRGWHAGEEQ